MWNRAPVPGASGHLREPQQSRQGPGVCLLKPRVHRHGRAQSGSTRAWSPAAAVLLGHPGLEGSLEGTGP